MRLAHVFELLVQLFALLLLVRLVLGCLGLLFVLLLSGLLGLLRGSFCQPLQKLSFGALCIQIAFFELLLQVLFLHAVKLRQSLV